MTKTIIQNSNLTKQQLLSIFDAGFYGRCDVYESRLPAVDLVVKKSSMIGMFVRLKHTPHGTHLKHGRIIPSTLLRAMFGNVLFQYLLLGFAFRKLESELDAFIKSSPHLNDASADPPPPSGALPESAPQAQARRHGLTAIWLGVTALLVPTLTGLFFYGEIGLWLSGQLLLIAALIAGNGFVASKVVGGDGLFRGAVIGLIAWAGGSLVASNFTWGPSMELERWLFPEGLLELGLFAVSGAVLALFHQRIAPSQQPVTATATSAASS